MDEYYSALVEENVGADRQGEGRQGLHWKRGSRAHSSPDSDVYDFPTAIIDMRK